MMPLSAVSSVSLLDIYLVLANWIGLSLASMIRFPPHGYCTSSIILRGGQFKACMCAHIRVDH